MVETKWYKWLEKNHEKIGMSIFYGAFRPYLEEQGFKLHVDYVDEEQLDKHKTVFQHFWSVKLKTTIF